MVVVVEDPLPPVVKPLCLVLEGPGVGGSGEKIGRVFTCWTKRHDGRP